MNVMFVVRSGHVVIVW